METFMAEAAQRQITIIEDGVPITKSLLQAFVANGGALGRKATDSYAGLDNSIFSKYVCYCKQNRRWPKRSYKFFE